MRNLIKNLACRLLVLSVFFSGSILLLSSESLAKAAKSRHVKNEKSENSSSSRNSFSSYVTKQKTLYAGLKSPWSLVELGDGEFVVTEKPGNLVYVDVKKQLRKVISGTPKVHYASQGGLLDVKKSYNYKSSKKIFLTYAKKVGAQYTTALASGVLDLDKFVLRNTRELFVADALSSKEIHYGSRLAVTPKYLFMTVGDRGARDLAQDLSKHSGKVLRLYHDGSFVKTNPFVGTPGAHKEIFSLGHRNPQGIFYDMSSQKLYVCEHGPRGGDEINLILPGKNYGWPVVSHGREYWGPKVSKHTSKNGLEDPLKVYVPSIAPSSLSFFGNEQVSAKLEPLKGKFLLGALVLTHLNVVDIKTGKEIRLLEDLEERIRYVNVSSRGRIYLLTDSGKLLELIEVKGNR